MAIVGVGLIGGSLGMAARRRGGALRVVGIDRPGVLRRARARGAVDEATSALARGVAGADLVVLALPVDAALRTLPLLARHLSPGAILTDVGSTKEAIAGRARRLGLETRFVGGHPMAGSERSGIAHADARLFEGAAWFLCPPGRSATAWRSSSRAGTALPARRVAALVRLVGARPVFLEPRAHDLIVARLSHLPQLVSVALTNAAARGGAGGHLRFAGPALRQMSRLADSPPGLWDGILKSNQSAAGRALDDVVSELKHLRACLRTGCASHFRRAARTRARIAAGMRGRAATG